MMSLTVTCQQNQANPFAHQTQLQRQVDEPESCPDRWMLWNYRTSLA
jgi:hypothetical protein